MWHVEVDEEKCIGCGECAEGCPGDVYELVNGKSNVVDEDECHGCYTCQELCEAEAIKISDD